MTMWNFFSPHFRWILEKLRGGNSGPYPNINNQESPIEFSRKIARFYGTLSLSVGTLQQVYMKIILYLM